MGGATHNKQAFLYSQKRKTRKCVCGRGDIFTDHNSKFNPVVDNHQVCVECKMDSIYDKVNDKQ